jgi:tetratricopeptide (TPR) repeat protein
MRQSTSIRLLIFFAVCVAFEVRATPVPEIVAKAKPAVVQVIASDANWSPIRTGTGFFVSADGDLLTNFHVIQGATHISARTDKGSIFVFERAIAESADSDVALLKFQATDVDFLKIGTSTNAVEGEIVLVIGNPEGLQGTVSNGIISAFRENRAYIQITAPVSPGSSGSPVLDETGQVIGMATLVSKEGQNLNFAISSEVIANVIRSGQTQVSAKEKEIPTPISDEQLALNHWYKAIDETIDKNYDGAINDYTAALQLQPNESGYYLGRADLYDRLGKSNQAIADYTEAARLKPSEASAFSCRGADYQKLGGNAQAVADLDEAIRLGGEWWAPLHSRGLANLGLGRYVAAIDDLTKAIRIELELPEEGVLEGEYYSRGVAYAGLKKYADAIRDFSQAIYFNSNYIEAYNARAKAYLASGEKEKAKSDLKQAEWLKTHTSL